MGVLYHNGLVLWGISHSYNIINHIPELHQYLLNTRITLTGRIPVYCHKLQARTESKTGVHIQSLCKSILVSKNGSSFLKRHGLYWLFTNWLIDYMGARLYFCFLQGASTKAPVTIRILHIRHNPYPEPVYTGWSSVHGNATGMPLVDLVYTGIPLENLVETAPHWNATAET